MAHGLTSEASTELWRWSPAVLPAPFILEDEVLRKLSLLLAVSTAVLVFPVAAQAYCVGVSPWTTGHVCGSIAKLKATGWKPAGPTVVLLCPRGSHSNCKGTTTTTQLDGYGKPYQNFTITNFSQYYNLTSYRDFDIYLYATSSTDYWGSEDAVHGIVTIGPLGLDGNSWAMAPRPLPPTPVYPSGTSVPNNYTVRWKSGLDADRTRYPTTYEVWFKYWPFGATEPSSWSLSAVGLPCHANGSGPDFNNECSTYVAGPQPAGNWKWFVVADANMSSVIVNPGVTTVFATESTTPMAFVQP
jgi:hypothetical protein